MNMHRIALNFEDGVTRFIECKEDEKVLDAAFRQRVNLPMDCADGVCGTCKCHAEAGRYELGDDYLEDALSDDEKARGLVLACQMRPSSDCVLSIPTSAAACKTTQSTFTATVKKLEPHDAFVVLELEVDDTAPQFLPGQYANVKIPGTNETRSYSFSSLPGERTLGFLIKRLPGGAMTTWLEEAAPGAKLELTGPFGSFYLRERQRPLLFIAGGTGLAPFLAMTKVLARDGETQPIHLVFGMKHDRELVMAEALETIGAGLAHFTFDTVVSDPASTHPRKGWVTEHITAEQLRGGDVDVYVCGPPPMVDTVRRHFDALGVQPKQLFTEKFTPKGQS